MRTLSSFFKTVIVALLLFTTSSVFAGAPTWTRVDYTNTTAFVGWVRINFYDASFPVTVEAGDYIGAFVGTECRMIAEVFLYNGNLYVSSVIHGGDVFEGYPSNDPSLDNTSEEIEWKVWDNSADVEIAATVKGTLFSDPGGEILDYEIGKPNTNSDLESLSVSGITLSPTFATATTSYSVELASGASLPVLVDYSAFATDSRATVTVTPATDFASNNVTTIRVTAEDGTFTEYTITYTQAACTVLAPGVMNIEYCVDAPAMPLTAIGVNLLWYTSPTGTGSATAPTPSTAIPGSTTYYVSQTDGCESPQAEIEVVVVDNPFPTITANPGFEVCVNESITLGVTGGLFFDRYWTGSAAVYLNSTSIAAPYFLAWSPGTFSLELYVKDANGCSGTATSSITVHPNPTYTITGGGTFCDGEVVTPVVVEFTEGTQPFSITHSGTTINNINATSYTLGSTAGTYVLTAISDAHCTGVVTTSNADITINPVPEATISANKLSYCATSISDVNLSVTPTMGVNLAGATYQWKRDGVNISTASTISGAIAGAYTVEVTLNGCAYSTPELVIEETALPTVSITPSATAVCSDELVSLNLVPASGGTLSGDGTSGLTFSPSVAGDGSHELTYSYTDGNGCSDVATTTITVTEKSLPTVAHVLYELELGASAPLLTASGSGTLTWYDELSNPVGTGASYQTTISTAIDATYTFTVTNTNGTCESDPVTITISVSGCSTQMPGVVSPVEYCVGELASALSATGTSLTWYSTATSDDGTTVAPTPNTGLAGTISYFVSQTDGCESARARIDVVVNALPTVSITPSATAVCSDEAVTLNLVPASGGTLSGTGTSGLTFSPSVAGNGSHVLTYSYTDGNGCSNVATTTIGVTEKTLPTVAQTLYELELGASAPILTASGSGTLTWYDESSNPVGTGTSYQTTISTAINATYTFTVTNTNGTCESDPVAITISVSGCSTQMPGVVSPVEYCVGELASALSATGTSLTWYSTATSDDGTTVAPTPNTGLAGTTSYFVSQTDGCESPRAKIDVVVKATPSAPTVANATQSVCDGEQASFTAIVLSGATIEWKNASSQIVGTQSLFSTSTEGQYTVTQEVNGCVSATQQVSLLVIDIPAVPVVADVETCEGTPAALTSSVISKWYTASTDVTPFATSVSYTPSVSSPDSYIYYVSQEISGCESAKVPVTYTIHETPSLVVQNQTAIFGTTIPNLTVTTDVSNTVTWYDVTQTNPLATGLQYATGETSIGTYYYYVEAISTNMCSSGKLPISLQITDCNLPKPTITPVTSAVCFGDANPTFTASATTGTVRWYSDANLTVLVGSGATFTPSVSVVGNYTFYAIQEGVCVSPSESVSLRINSLPNPQIFAPTSLYQNDDPVLLSVSPLGGSLLGTGLSGNSFDPSSVTPGYYTFTYTYSDVNSCVNQATHQIQVLSITYADRTQLGDTITRAESIFTTYESSAEFSAAAKLELQSAIIVAQYYYDNYQDYTDADLLEQTNILSDAIQDFLDSRVSVVDVSALIAKRDEAVQVYQNNEYRQGTNVGQIPTTAFTEFQNAIDNANSYISIPPATQEEVFTQVSILEDAIQAFLDAEIVQPAVTSISVEESIVNLVAGEVFVPTVVYSPIGSYGDILWTSSNPEVASVVGISGTVTASDISGTAQITGTLISNPSITLQYVVQVSGVPEIVRANLIGIANQIELEFTEVMQTPESSVYTDLIIGGVNPLLYTITNVQVDPLNSKKLIVSLGTVVNDPDEILISYSGTSIQSIAGAPAPDFEIRIEGTAVDVVESNIFVYPTVSSEYVYVEGVENAKSISVISATGQKILDIPVIGNKVMIDVQALAQGTYTIRIIRKTSIIQAQFMKQ